MAVAEETGDMKLVTNTEKTVAQALRELPEPATSDEIGKDIEATSTHIRRCLKSLGEQGLVESEQSPDDGRVLLHRLTDDARASELISNREDNARKPAYFFTDSDGYEHSRSCHNRKIDDVLIHRLVAVAEFGFDAVVGHEVHHLKPIPWYNTGDNLVPLTKDDHLRGHADRDAFDAIIARLPDSEVREALAEAGYTEAALALNSDE